MGDVIRDLDGTMIQKLKEYDDQYYNTGTSPVSDLEYDRMKDAAKSLYPEHPYFQTVGAKIKGEKVKLPYLLGSLSKEKLDSVEAWVEQAPGDIIVTDKIDGVSLFVRYQDGEVVFAATRGDGHFGQDVTEKAKIFCPKVDFRGSLELRGDSVLLGDPKELGYKTRRNGAAGILNRDDLKGSDKISVYFYELINSTVKPAPIACHSTIVFNSEYERLSFLREELGLPMPRVRVLKPDKVDTINFLLDMNSTRDQMPYEADGLVLTRNSSVRENVALPKHKIAFKINDEAKRVTVTDVEWNVGRTGRVVPVVIIEPTEIGGVTISRATGFNYEFVAKNGITKGVEISLVRSGDVIPYIVDVHSDKLSHDLFLFRKKKFTLFFGVPTKCPVCGGQLRVKGVDLVCETDDCSEQVYARIEYFLRTLGAENLTAVTLKKLGITTLERAYDIDEYEIANYDGFGLKRGEVIVNEIRKTLRTTPDKFLTACGLPNVALETARALLNECSLAEYMGGLYDVGTEQTFEAVYEKIDGIGPKTAKVLYDNRFKVLGIYNRMLEFGMSLEEKKGMLKGKIFTLTGSYTIKRDNLINWIEEKGGIVKGISKSTSYLVAANPDSQSGKAKKARQYGIKVISYNDLIDMLEE